MRQGAYGSPFHSDHGAVAGVGALVPVEGEGIGGLEVKTHIQTAERRVALARLGIWTLAHARTIVS